MGQASSQDHFLPAANVQREGGPLSNAPRGFEIHEGKLRDTEEKVLLITLPPDLNSDENERERFKHLCQRMLSVAKSCKHVQQCKGWTTLNPTSDDPSPKTAAQCLVAQLFEHGNLESCITEAAQGNGDPLALPTVMGIAEDIAEGLSEVHKQGETYNLTPSNVLFSDQERKHAVLSILGLAMDTSHYKSSSEDMQSLGVLLGQLITQDLRFPQPRAAAEHDPGEHQIYKDGVHDKQAPSDAAMPAA